MTMEVFVVFNIMKIIRHQNVVGTYFILYNMLNDVHVVTL